VVAIDVSPYGEGHVSLNQPGNLWISQNLLPGMDRQRRFPKHPCHSDRSKRNLPFLENPVQSGRLVTMLLFGPASAISSVMPVRVLMD
jgi:hypothetical protein